MAVASFAAVASFRVPTSIPSVASFRSQGSIVIALPACGARPARSGRAPHARRGRSLERLLLPHGRLVSRLGSRTTTDDTPADHASEADAIIPPPPFAELANCSILPHAVLTAGYRPTAAGRRAEGSPAKCSSG